MNKDKISIDDTDWRILAIMQQNARTPFTKIGRAVGLTSPAVKERVVRMEDAGLIKSYRAEIDYKLAGRELRAIIMLKIKNHDRMTTPDVFSYNTLLKEISGVVRAWDVTGDVECVADVAVPGMKELDNVLMKLNALGFVTTTYIVLSDTGELQALPYKNR